METEEPALLPPFRPRQLCLPRRRRIPLLCNGDIKSQVTSPLQFVPLVSRESSPIFVSLFCTFISSSSFSSSLKGSGVVCYRGHPKCSAINVSVTVAVLLCWRRRRYSVFVYVILVAIIIIVVVNLGVLLGEKRQGYSERCDYKLHQARELFRSVGSCRSEKQEMKERSN